MLSDIQTVIIVGSPSGSFQLSLDDLTTDSIPCGASAALVQNTIGNCTVTLVAVSAYVITTTAGDKFFKLYPKNDFFNNRQYHHQYRTDMNNQPKSLIVVEHTIAGTTDTDDVQTLITTDSCGLFTLVVKHHDDTLDSTTSIQRNSSANIVEQSLNDLPTIYDQYNISVVANTAIAYRVTFPGITGLPRMTPIPSFSGGTYPTIVVDHTVVAGVLLPNCCFVPSVVPDIDTPKIIIQRLTR